MQDELFKGFLREVARKHGISTAVLERAWKNQFKMVRDTIANSIKTKGDSFKTVYLRNLGKFVPRMSEMKYMNDDKRDN
jgi:transposase-like protein